MQPRPCYHHNRVVLHLFLCIGGHCQFIHLVGVLMQSGIGQEPTVLALACAGISLSGSEHQLCSHSSGIDPCTSSCLCSPVWGSMDILLVERSLVGGTRCEKVCNSASLSKSCRLYVKVLVTEGTKKKQQITDISG